MKKECIRIKLLKNHFYQKDLVLCLCNELNLIVTISNKTITLKDCPSGANEPVEAENIDVCTIEGNTNSVEFFKYIYLRETKKFNKLVVHSVVKELDSFMTSYELKESENKMIEKSVKSRLTNIILAYDNTLNPLEYSNSNDTEPTSEG